MDRSSYIHHAAVIGLLLLAVGGCKEKEFSVAPVSGKVTFNNQPLAGARVKFQPISQGREIEVGGGSYATTDDQGNFSLMLILQDGEGAIIGDHRVTISTGTSQANSDLSTITGERAAARWLQGEVEFTVPPEGTTQANFDVAK